MPNKYKHWKFVPKGVSNRNKGLSWIRTHATEGVFYFADDDNTYDLEIFCQVCYIVTHKNFFLNKPIRF